MVSVVAMAMAVPMAIGDNDPIAGTSAGVNNEAPAVCEKSEVPNPVMPNQCPNPVDVTIKACVCDRNGNDEITQVVADVYDPSTALYATVNLARNADGDAACTVTCPASGGPCVQWTGTLTMQAWDPAGNYQVVVDAFDGLLWSAQVENTLVYQSLTAMTASDVNFGDLDPGATNTVSSTVTVYGNEDLKFVDEVPTGTPNKYDDPDPNDGIVWSDLTSGGNVIPDDQITTTWVPATCIAGCDETAGASSANVPFTLVVPSPQAAGAYTGSITFTPSVC